MSGLLDKANKTAADTTDEPKESSEAVLTDVTPVASGSGLNMGQLKFQITAVFGFLITMILVFFIDNVVLFGDITLDDFFVPGVILWWLVFNGEDLKQQSFDTKKLVASGVGFLVVTALFAGVAILNASDSGVTIANIEYDGDDDEIDLSFYGPKGMDYTIEVIVDGTVEYSHDATINIDKGTHSVSLDDFWKGNAQDMNGGTLVEYEIKVTSDGGEESMTFDDIMNREVDTAFVRITEVFTTNDQDKTYTGITVEMILGMGNPSANYNFANDYFTGTTPKPIASDWTATLTVKLGSNTQYTYNSITADEGIANGVGEFRFDWVMLPGTESGNLARDSFYADDGCYTFEVEIVNEHGDTHVDSSSKIQFYWDDNEASNDDQDQPAEAC
jgi:hypothetical protein